MALSYGVTDYIEGGVITAVIVLNVLIGFYQEFQAEKKMVRTPLRKCSFADERLLRTPFDLSLPHLQLFYETAISKPSLQGKWSQGTLFKSRPATLSQPTFVFSTL